VEYELKCAILNAFIKPLLLFIRKKGIVLIDVIHHQVLICKSPFIT